jgi:hypothetical protein
VDRNQTSCVAAPYRHRNLLRRHANVAGHERSGRVESPFEACNALFDAVHPATARRSSLHERKPASGKADRRADGGRSSASGRCRRPARTARCWRRTIRACAGGMHADAAPSRRSGSLRGAPAPDELRLSVRRLGRLLYPCRSGHVAVDGRAAASGVVQQRYPRRRSRCSWCETATGPGGAGCLLARPEPDHQQTAPTAARPTRAGAGHVTIDTPGPGRLAMTSSTQPGSRFQVPRRVSRGSGREPS